MGQIGWFEIDSLVRATFFFDDVKVALGQVWAGTASSNVVVS